MMRILPVMPRRARGLSLIELMVAIAIGMIIMAFLLALYVNVTRANNEMARMNRQIENGRFAMQLLQNDLVHAGFWADFMPQFEDRSIITPGDVPNAIPDPCEADVDWADPTADADYKRNLIGIAVQAGAGSCGVVSALAGNDVLVVRHAEPAAAVAACPLNEVCFQASQCGLEIKAVPPQSHVLGTDNHTLHRMNCEGTGSPAVLPITGGDTAGIRRFVSNIYYVRDDFTLMRAEFRNGAHQPAQPLIEGIEALRVEYGIDNIGRNGAPVNYTVGAVNRGDGIPDQYVTAAGLTCNSPAACPAANVVAVRLYVLARSLEPTPGYDSSGKRYCLGTNPDGTCANLVGPFDDGIKRHVFTTTVRLVNPAGRRETP